jgi:hypothetical protein
VGHATWDSYTAMTRIFKHYEFNFSNPAGERRRGEGGLQQSVRAKLVHVCAAEDLSTPPR